MDTEEAEKDSDKGGSNAKSWVVIPVFFLLARKKGDKKHSCNEQVQWRSSDFLRSKEKALYL